MLKQDLIDRFTLLIHVCFCYDQKLKVLPHFKQTLTFIYVATLDTCFWVLNYITANNKQHNGVEKNKVRLQLIQIPTSPELGAILNS